MRSDQGEYTYDVDGVEGKGNVQLGGGIFRCSLLVSEEHAGKVFSWVGKRLRLRGRILGDDGRTDREIFVVLSDNKHIPQTREILCVFLYSGVDE